MVLAVIFIFGLEASLLKNQVGSSLSFHVLGIQSSCLSLDSSCEEFKGALSRSASPKNVLHADFSQNLNMAKLTVGPSFYLDFPTDEKYLACSFHLCHYSFSLPLKNIAKRKVSCVYFISSMTSCFENFEYVYRLGKEKISSTFSLFALIHSLKRKFRINDKVMGL